ncbi:hypothetical protein HMN09_01138500 [Mycena chlorophos]|uniref:Uncharacterized protein n=1 Tax=Mycena chlorophos TaxID=658473 RepID=A0A8H6S8E6_MYCCL|nr:hypothetical protein HMN09_01138500 [Mycena chlorophos]
MPLLHNTKPASGASRPNSTAGLRLANATPAAAAPSNLVHCMTEATANEPATGLATPNNNHRQLKTRGGSTSANSQAQTMRLTDSGSAHRPRHCTALRLSRRPLLRPQRPIHGPSAVAPSTTPHWHPIRSRLPVLPRQLPPTPNGRDRRIRTFDSRRLLAAFFTTTDPTRPSATAEDKQDPGLVRLLSLRPHGRPQTTWTTALRVQWVFREQCLLRLATTFTRCHQTARRPLSSNLNYSGRASLRFISLHVSGFDIASFEQATSGLLGSRTSMCVRREAGRDTVSFLHPSSSARFLHLQHTMFLHHLPLIIPAYVQLDSPSSSSGTYLVR